MTRELSCLALGLITTMLSSNTSIEDLEVGAKHFGHRNALRCF